MIPGDNNIKGKGHPCKNFQKKFQILMIVKHFKNVPKFYFTPK